MSLFETIITASDLKQIPSLFEEEIKIYVKQTTIIVVWCGRKGNRLPVTGKPNTYITDT